MKNLILAVVICLSLHTVASAQTCVGNNCDTSASSYAVRLNGIGRLVHDRSYRGPEVIYWSSSPASESEAIAAWKRSPGHARLVNSGQITDIACYGNYCVGRGNAERIGLAKPIAPVRSVIHATESVVQRTGQAVCNVAQRAACTTRRVASGIRSRLRCR